MGLEGVVRFCVREEVIESLRGRNGERDPASAGGGCSKEADRHSGGIPYWDQVCPPETGLSGSAETRGKRQNRIQAEELIR